MIKYWPTVLEIHFTDQLGPFIHIHFRRTILFGSNPIEGYPSRSDIFLLIFGRFFAEKSKNNETSSMDFKVESPNYGDQRWKKMEFSKTPTSYSPTVALIGWKHFKNSYFKKDIV